MRPKPNPQTPNASSRADVPIATRAFIPEDLWRTRRANAKDMKGFPVYIPSAVCGHRQQGGSMRETAENTAFMGVLRVKVCFVIVSPRTSLAWGCNMGEVTARRRGARGSQSSRGDG